MKTKYNLTATIEQRQGYIPKKLYDKLVEQYKTEGLLGRKRVTLTGRIVEGHDLRCDKNIIGEFDVEYREGMDETIREILERLKLTSGSDRVMQEAIELGEITVDSLEKMDPSSQVLSWKDYNSFPICSNMELNTPLGRQSVHIHTENGRIIQFWRPNKERQWYDWDTFNGVLKDAFFEEMDLASQKISIPRYSLIKRLGLGIKRRKIRNLSKIYREIIYNPGCIDKVDFL